MKATPTVQEFIFGDERPFASCHAVTLALLASGDLLAAWFGGSREGAGDVGIWLSRRSGSTWSPPLNMAEREGLPHWNPVLFSPDGRHVQLYYKVGVAIPEWRTMVRGSADGGATWSEPRELVPGDRAGGRGPVKNKPIVTSEGLWLAPASVEGRYWDAFVDVSADEGLTWRASNLVAFPHDESYEGTGLIQPTLWESSPGLVHMLMRSRTGRIWRSDSTDGGRSWGLGRPTFLPNNSSGIDLARTETGILALAYNPVGMPKGPRSPLVLGLSLDEGESWRQGAIVEIDPGEYSYPAIVAAGEELHLAYTWNRTRIAYRRYIVQP
ncbi:MAG TPA: sialidase family protein [Rectinemataceae bacterium]|nr:sialidase family protein [Rectinemataceae bacterium]